MKRHWKILVFSIMTIAVVAVFFAFDLSQYLNLPYLKDRRQALMSFYDQNPVQTVSWYLCIYVLSTAVSIPGAGVLTVAGGALFGLWFGTLLVSIGATLGATFAFWTSRILLKDMVRKIWKDALRRIDKGIRKDGAYYLLTLRLVPVFPYVLVNLLMGLTPIATAKYVMVSLVGMLPATMIYVQAGTQISGVESLQDILSADFILSLSLIGIFPIATRWLGPKIQARIDRFK